MEAGLISHTSQGAGEDWEVVDCRDLIDLHVDSLLPGSQAATVLGR